MTPGEEIVKKTVWTATVTSLHVYETVVCGTCSGSSKS